VRKSQRGYQISFNAHSVGSWEHLLLESVEERNRRFEKKLKNWRREVRRKRASVQRKKKFLQKHMYLAVGSSLMKIQQQKKKKNTFGPLGFRLFSWCRSFLYFNNNTTRNSTSHYRTVSILRVSIHRDCIGCVYQALIKSILIYPLEKCCFCDFYKLKTEIKCWKIN